jgi:citrate synthase
MKQLPASDGMDTLRTLTSALGHYDRDASDSSPQANYRKAVRLTAQLGSLVSTYGRMQRGGGPIQPDPALGHAANFLYMLTGDRPNALSTRAFDVALVLHADHELNASTFAARVAAATLTDLHSAIVGAIGTLKGPLHGGANADVMRLLIDIGQDATPERIDDAIRARLAKVKIPGFGHRVCATEDPRATHLRRMSKELGRRAGTRDGSRCPGESKRSSPARRSCIPTSISTPPRPTTRWASRSISSRRSSP